MGFESAYRASRRLEMAPRPARPRANGDASGSLRDVLWLTSQVRGARRSPFSGTGCLSHRAAFATCTLAIRRYVRGGLTLTTVKRDWLTTRAFRHPAPQTCVELPTSGRVSSLCRSFWLAPCPTGRSITLAVNWPLVGLGFLPVELELNQLDPASRTPAVWPTERLRLSEGNGCHAGESRQR